MPNNYNPPREDMDEREVDLYELNENTYSAPEFSAAVEKLRQMQEDGLTNRRAEFILNSGINPRLWDSVVGEEDF